VAIERDVTASLDSIRGEMDDVLNMSEELQLQISYKVDELESLKERSENLSADINDHLTNLEGLQTSLDEFEDVRDAASNHEIEVS